MEDRGLRGIVSPTLVSDAQPPAWQATLLSPVCGPRSRQPWPVHQAAGRARRVPVSELCPPGVGAGRKPGLGPSHKPFIFASLPLMGPDRRLSTEGDGGLLPGAGIKETAPALNTGLASFWDCLILLALSPAWILLTTLDTY